MESAIDSQREGHLAGLMSRGPELGEDFFVADDAREDLDLPDFVVLLLPPVIRIAHEGDNHVQLGTRRESLVRNIQTLMARSLKNTGNAAWSRWVILTALQHLEQIREDHPDDQNHVVQCVWLQKKQNINDKIIKNQPRAFTQITEQLIDTLFLRASSAPPPKSALAEFFLAECILNDSDKQSTLAPFPRA
jgi:hypothetical protein